MRRAAIALGAIVGATVVVALLMVANLNTLVASNRDRIVAGMSEGFARPVTVDTITVGFHAGIALELRGLRVADDPAYSSDDFLAADRVDVIVRFWPLLHRRIELRRINVRAPRLTIIRGAKGLNVDSLGRKPAAAPSQAKPSASGEGSDGIPAFAIAVLNLDGGSVRYVNRMGATPVETLVEPLDVHLSDLSLTTPIRVEVEAATKTEPPTIVRMHGNVGPVGESPFATDVPIEHHVRVRSPGLAIDDLAVTGTIRRTPDGKPIAHVHVSAPEVRSPDVTIANLDVSLAEEEGAATLEKLAFGVFDGTIEGKGRVVHVGAPTFSFESVVRGVDVSKALRARAPETAERFTGHLDADLSVSGAGGDAAVMRRSLTGKGRVVVRDGVLHGVNIGDKVLTGVTSVGGLVTLVPPRIRDKYPAIFSGDDTPFDELSSDVHLANEHIQVDVCTVAARDYAIRGKGVVTFAQQVDLTATLVASAAFTADVIGSIKEAKYLTDDQGRLSIPFRLTGQMPNVHAKADADFVSRVLQKAIVGEGLDQLLGGGKGDDPKDPKHKDGGGLLKKLDKLFGH